MSSYEKPALTRQQRARQIGLVLCVTLVLNWVVAALKIVFGLATHCMVIFADGLHSFSDGASNIIGLVAITIAGHPADRDHPYGHQKFETFASVVISFFLFAVSLGILREAISGLIHPRRPEVTAASFILMGLTFAVNIFVVWYERRAGRRLNSDLLLSDSWHTLTDLFVTFSVFIALIGIAYRFDRLDAVFTFVISIVIFVTALSILRRGLDVLVDKAVMAPDQIEKIVRQIGAVRDCHEIRTRGRADNIYVDLHVLVDSNMSVLESHRVANIIEHDIRARIPGVCDVVVHIEPVSHDHKEIEG